MTAPHGEAHNVVPNGTIVRLHIWGVDDQLDFSVENAEGKQDFRINGPAEWSKLFTINSATTMNFALLNTGGGTFMAHIRALNYHTNKLYKDCDVFPNGSSVWPAPPEQWTGTWIFEVR